VEQNLIDAYKWYAAAAAQGDKQAASRVEVLAKELKPAELAQAMRAAAEFKPESTDGNGIAANLTP
jgi:localization factor PodJL